MEEIVDIEKIDIDTSMTKEIRIRQFVKEIKNPYRFKVEDMIVNVAFAGNGNTLQDRLHQYFQLLIV